MASPSTPSPFYRTSSRQPENRGSRSPESCRGRWVAVQRKTRRALAVAHGQLTQSPNGVVEFVFEERGKLFESRREFEERHHHSSLAQIGSDAVDDEGIEAGERFECSASQAQAGGFFDTPHESLNRQGAAIRVIRIWASPGRSVLDLGPEGVPHYGHLVSSVVMASKEEIVKNHVLELFEGIYGEEVEDVLATDPNDFDLDPSMFYELLQEMFGVEYDDDNDYFGGFGGSVQDTINFIASRWDGETLNAVPMPPMD